MARPTKYSNEIAEKICYLVATTSKGLETICEENADLPTFKTVFNWLSDKNKDEFLQLYVRARENQGDALADEILKTAFSPAKNLTEAQDKRTKIDALKWLASKLKPKKYGDKLDVTTDGEKITSFNIGFNKPTNEQRDSED